MSSEWVREVLRLQGRGEHLEALRICPAAPTGERARFAAHTLRATSLAALGRDTEAREALQATLALAAPPLEWCRRAVQACRAVDALALARQLVDRALDAGGPATLVLLPLRADLNGELHLLGGGAEHAERVAALLPRDVGARVGLARAYCEAHLHALAAQELDAALELEPANVEAGLEWAGGQLELGDGAGALRMLHGLGERELSTADQVRRAGLLWRSGALEDAKRAAECALRAAPQSRETRLQCASFALWCGELGAARQHLIGLREDDPNLASIQASLAFVAGNLAAAVEHATRALAQDPEQLAAGAVAIAALLRLDRVDEARARASVLKQAADRLHSGLALVEASLMCRAYGALNHTVLDAFELVAPIFGGAGLDPASEASRARLLALLDGAIDRLSGNFGPDATYLVGETRVPRRLDTKQPARIACVRAAAAIKARPVPWVVARVLALKAEYPESPLVHTHAAELHLWHGDYAACEAECRAALALSETFSRWAWVGLGAARMFQGQVQDALDVFAQSDRRMPPGGPLHAYRGEALRLAGELDAAERELRLSLQANPNRVSAWLNLALTAAARGDGEPARELCARLSARLPGLVQDVERDTLRSRGANTAALEPVALLEALLRAMRGNRSSGTITYFLSDGLARSATAQPLQG